MKALLLILVSQILAGCFSLRDFTAECDYNYSGRFRKYKTFAFQEEQDPVLAGEPLNPMIESAIKKRMEIQGYQYRKERPDLVIGYRLFYDDVDIIGYIQPEFERWLRTGNANPEYEHFNYRLKKGTIFISIKSHGEVVWQGYSTSAIRMNEFNSEKYLYFAVLSIFDKYRVFPNDPPSGRERK